MCFLSASRASVALLLFSSICIAVCYDEKAEFRRHAKLLKKFPCKDPQPRVFELEDVIPNKDMLDKYEGVRKYIRPQVTVLHRCYATGCCDNREQRCMPLETKEVTLTFGIYHHTIDFFNVTAINHTSCFCGPYTPGMKMSDNIK